jgi:hypothetical protein
MQQSVGRESSPDHSINSLEETSKVSMWYIHKLIQKGNKKLHTPETKYKVDGPGL